ncbi:Mrp/NBP35 family ATP-binding protein [Peptostreptococcus anaerobius]|uniref:Mrp/NBP35 family ATP-binding protein n=1 Tax=Peptostreptococcus anaerobius TaxID=1261 RepID=UPI0029000A6F|nr:Mrp/NBP35 family ATP-binding protein [Peptostreptococcus anaerobius]MDU1598873.1 Mrp/NBP35 family ATP-binding protein [Peptostreptococcus anaerobius]MDU1682522.1 Mrp/NBP35 family ATP-binding protein [Peptostreptococcus anaerobius]
MTEENRAIGDSTNKPNNNIKKVIGVMSGKGGVGKSTVTTLLAQQLVENGHTVGILDADITGPSIPKLLNMGDAKAYSDGDFIVPAMSQSGIKVVSLNLLIDEEEAPVIWRGPMVGGAVQQFYNDTVWGDLDYLLIDMPPGTGDVALTVMQSIRLTGIVMVSIPQNLVSMIVAKAINMAKQMDIPVIGLVENMSYVPCPSCDEKIRIFKDDNLDSFLKEYDLDLLGELPMSAEVIDITNNGIKSLSPGLKEEVVAMTKKVENYKRKYSMSMFGK